MPTFLEKTWSDTRPKSGKDLGIAGAIKNWNLKCPDTFETFSNPTVMKAATDAADLFLKAITTAEGKINADKSKDEKTKKQILATKTLLTKWENEIKKYKNDANEWSKKYMQEQGSLIRGNEKKLVEAQELFYSLTVVTFEAAIAKLPITKKEFVAAIEKRQGDIAGAKLESYRNKIKEGTTLSSDKNIAAIKKRVAERYEVPIKELTLDPKYATLRQNFAKLDNDEDVMEVQLEHLTDELASEDAPITGKTDEQYKRVIGEILAGYKKIAQDVKAQVPLAVKCLTTAQKIHGLSAQPNLDPVNAQKLVDGARQINETMFAAQKKVVALLGLTRNNASPLRAKAVQIGLTPEDNKKVLLPQMNVAYAANKSFLAAVGKAKDLLQDSLESLVENQPTLQSASTELSNMGSKYKVDTQV